jgi:hypothetical protein
MLRSFRNIVWPKRRRNPYSQSDGFESGRTPTIPSRPERAQVKPAVCAVEQVSRLSLFSVEILQLIFIECLPADSNAIIHASEAPLLLTHVCRHWRRIAQGTAELWATLHVCIPPRYEGSSYLADLRCAAMQVWLPRSVALPLHVSFYAYCEQGQPAIEFATDVVPFLIHLLPYAARLHSLEFNLPPHLLSALSLISGPLAESLKKFTLIQTSVKVNVPSRAAARPPSLPFLQSTVNLTSLTMAHGYFLTNCPLQMPKQHLCHLQLNVPIQIPELKTEQVVATFLSQFRVLESCTLRLQNDDNPGTTFKAQDITAFSSSRHCELRCLKSLTFSASVADAESATRLIIDILWTLFTPKLDTLAFPILLEGRLNLMLANALEDLVTRSSCRIVTLSVHSGLTELRPLFPSIQRLSDVQSFTISLGDGSWDSAALSDAFLQHLLYQPSLGKIPFLPKLKSLRMTNYESYSTDVLREALVSRSLVKLDAEAKICPLEEVVLEYGVLYFHPINQIRSDIRELQEMAIKLVVRPANSRQASHRAKPYPSPWLGRHFISIT